VSSIGFRRWRVSAAGELVGLGVPHVWASDRETAVCRGLDGIGFGNCNPFRVWPGHPAPSLRSRCGIWAHQDPIRPCQCGEPDSAAHGAVGAVRLWGRFVEHETGWRAEHARVVALVDFTGRMTGAYPVPKYPDLDSMYGEWAPERTGWAPGEPAVWCHPDLALPAAVSFLQYAVQIGGEVQRGLNRVNEVVQANLRPWLDRLGHPAGEPAEPGTGAGPRDVPREGDGREHD
jgi:hypothetical protein